MISMIILIYLLVPFLSYTNTVLQLKCKSLNLVHKKAIEIHRKYQIRIVCQILKKNTEKNVLLKITMFYCNRETDSNS